MKPTQDKKNVRLALLAALAAFMVVSPLGASANEFTDERALPTVDEAIAAADAGMLVVTGLKLPTEVIVETEEAVVTAVEDTGLLFIIPAILELAERYGLDVVFDNIPSSSATAVGISVDGVELDQAEVIEGAAFFENVPVSGNLTYSFTLYENSTALQDFVDVQALVPHALDMQNEPILDLTTYVQEHGNGTFGVPGLFNVQPDEADESALNFVDELPEELLHLLPDNPVTPAAGAGAGGGGGTGPPPYNPDAQPCRQGANRMQSQLAGVHGDNREAALNQWGILATGEWRVEVAYYHDCGQGTSDRGHFGFGWAWGGINDFEHNELQAFNWNTAAEGSKVVKRAGNTYTGHEIAVSGSKAFLYNPNNVYASYISNEEMGRSSESCYTEWTLWGAIQVANFLLNIGRRLDINIDKIPTKRCDTNWSSISSSWSGSGRGVDSNYWANGRGKGNQINPHGELKVEFYGCSPFQLHLEGASEHTANTRASPTSPWIKQRAWLYMQQTVPANVC